MQEEIWKDIEGYEGLYQVSNLGRVKSLVRITTHNRILKSRVLKPSTKDSRYLRVQLSKNNLTSTISIHRLVAIAFIDNPENKPQVNHINENKHDNRACNLNWMTNRENVNYSANKRSSSQYAGVCWHKGISSFVSRCRIDGNEIHLGSFKNEEDAAQAYVCFCAIHDLR